MQPRHLLVSQMLSPAYKKNPDQAIPSDLFLQARVLSVSHSFSKRSPFTIMMFVSNQINRPKSSQSSNSFKTQFQPILKTGMEPLQKREKRYACTWMSSLNTRCVLLYLARNRNAFWFAKSSNCNHKPTRPPSFQTSCTQIKPP